MPTPIEGHWEMVRAEFSGEVAPELVVNQTELHLEAGRYAIWFAGEPVEEGTYELGSNKAPPLTITLHGATGPNAGRTVRCIYQQMGARMRICFGTNGTLPTAFSTTPGDERYLASYRLRLV